MDKYTDTAPPRHTLYAAIVGSTSRGADLGLLVLRIWFGLALLLKHGLEKPAHFTQMAAHFPDPLHLGSATSLVIALISDTICSVLVVVGLVTRPAALFACANVFVAWAFVHHFQFFGHAADHGELIVLYIGAFLALAITGPGRFSIDAILHNRNR